MLSTTTKIHAILFIQFMFLTYFVKTEQKESEITMNIECEDRSEYWLDINNRTCSDIAMLEEEELERSCNKVDIIEGFTAFSACCGKD